MTMMSDIRFEITPNARTGVRFDITTAATAPAVYSGETSITPSDAEQVLATNGLVLTSDITVAAIPSDYGKITYDGSQITVS